MSKMTKDSVANAYELAADVLKTGPWCKGHWSISREGEEVIAHCAEGAIGVVAGVPDEFMQDFALSIETALNKGNEKLFKRLSKARSLIDMFNLHALQNSEIKVNNPNSSLAMSNWNDDKEVSRRAVVGAFRRFAEAIRSGTIKLSKEERTY